ncbi:MAG: indolepyruvate ferredoxin oxidoreductase family protein [Alphaproteobacteria bacterium]|nr:indolepyruvate ferredoxin oxidoreductase family protein [Alphaproteobacteria bacterium]
MNAPLPEHIRQALETVTLDDKYSLDHGRAFMSGVQALVKLPMLQRQRDAMAGKNTAGFISGYRGSPLGGYDQALWRAKKFLQAQHIVFQPGVNEELAATALWGTQQLGFAPPGNNRFDGVFGIWYGKGPGVDRCSDVFKHANMAGTTPWGGVLAVAGDDHVAKSSTAAHQSDPIFMACSTPVFFPASVQDILDHGLHAFALSRYAGLWAGMKTIQEIVESSATATIDPRRVQVVLPELELPPGGLHIRWPDEALAQEARLFQHKWPAVQAYLRANRLNHDIIRGPQDRFGLIASGKAYNDTRQALNDLGLDEATCQRLGVRLHKVGVVWPLEPEGLRDFARGLREILVVEEKRPILEPQIKELLYHWPDGQRPEVNGKFDHPEGTGGFLLRPNHELNPALIARAIARRLLALGVDADTRARIEARLALLDAKERSLQTQHVQADRLPWFCSGCPHNTSTKVPEGSRAMAGIGCHFMSLWMDRSTSGFTQMGGEGVPWVGQQPFSHDAHIFANIGDGTYFHSGLLAVRQSVAAGVNITYKILYNDAVAMTGGQPVGERPEGHTPVQIAQSMVAEGARRVVVVTDEPEKYEGVRGLPEGVAVEHRDRLDAIQREMREIKGCTVIIYDQTCATEKRRRRKRGTMVDPALRVLINPAVCEGCGDCSDQSNCISIEPLETELGRKRTVNQSTCNKDTSCLKGFCPSFVTVQGGQLKKGSSRATALPQGGLPEPERKALQGPWGIVVAGVGGTGVITIGQLLGMAAHIDGVGVVTQDSAGLAQKGGATWAHVVLAPRQEDISTTRVGMAGADLVLGCDPIVSAGKETLQRMLGGRTHVALNGHSTPTAAFVKDGGWRDPSEQCVSDIATTIEATAHPGLLGVFDANLVATQLLGDSIFINPMVLGYAWQKGWIPLSLESLWRAIELNEVQVDKNKAAFEWGRHCAHDWAAVQALLQPAQVVTLHRPQKLGELVARRVELLTQYQNAAYARQYGEFVERVRLAEEKALPGQDSLTRAVAQGLYKLMAYKDEYEVARLHSDPGFVRSIGERFEGDYRLQYHLAPPLLARRNDKDELQKQAYGPWMLSAFKVLAKLKFLRGTALDPFGYTEERRSERALIGQYRQGMESLLATLGTETREHALEVARWPESIKGYGHVKERHLAKAQVRWGELVG